MRKILITGSNSYVGNSFEKWIKKSCENNIITKMSVRDDTWKEKSFSSYNSIFHVAGIAHVSSNPKMKELYYKVNCDLTLEIARKAKKDGVRQFIFMSSIIVYGDSSKINKKKVINIKTKPTPSNFYGESKLNAEKKILSLEDENFKVAIIRAPMIYGKGSKGNYNKLSNMCSKIHAFPNIENERSMIHIDNLCEFVRLIIDKDDYGIFFPQNKEYVNTSELVKEIASLHGNRIILTKIFNPLIIVSSMVFKSVNKLFGNLVYDKELSVYKENYIVRDFKESLIRTEK